jgi:hypothetical protein
VNLNQVKAALPYLFESKLVGLLIGTHGVGKSTAVREYTEEQGIGFIDLRLGQMEVGDLLGLPEITTDAKGDKITVFARPKWFPTSGKGVLFLDEINRAKRDVIQAVFQLVLDRKLHDYALPDGWHVVSAMNPNSEDYQTLDLSDKAFLDRFCHIKISSSYQDFIAYGETKGFDKTVTGFINNHPGMLRGANKEFTLDNVEPSDRSWAAVSRLVKNKNIPEDTLNELVTGLVGLTAATAFLAYKKTADKPVEGKLILKDYKKVQKAILAQVTTENYRPDLLNETMVQINEIITAEPKDKEPLTDKEYKNLVAFMIDLPPELFTKFNLDLFKTPKLFLKLADESDTNKVFEKKIEDCAVTKLNAAAARTPGAPGYEDENATKEVANVSK